MTSRRDTPKQRARLHVLDTPGRFRKARAHCQTIAALMRPTEKLRQKDGAAVLITADLWKRIYDNARKGAML